MICIPVHFAIFAIVGTPIFLLFKVVEFFIKKRDQFMPAYRKPKVPTFVFPGKNHPLERPKGGARPSLFRRLFGRICRFIHVSSKVHDFSIVSAISATLSPLEWSFASVSLFCFFLISLVSRLVLMTSVFSAV